MKLKHIISLLIFTMLFFVSGCGLSEIDELYSLPKPQQEYLQLQKLIDTEIAGGSEYSAPVLGALRQSVQLADLNGDGVDEALAFLRNSELEPEICIYRRNSGLYELATRITGEGTGIGTFEYEDINSDGISEIFLSFRTSGDLKILKVYELQNWKSSVLLTTNCTDFKVGDSDKDGNEDLVVLNFSPGEGKLEIYTADAEGEMAMTGAKLSPSMMDIDIFRISAVGDGYPAIFVEGSFDLEGEIRYITDVFAVVDGKLKNILLNPVTGDSKAIRDYEVYCSDIDGDRMLEIPYTEEISSQPGVTATYHIFDWYACNIKGRLRLVDSTYHCYSDGWYYVLPPEWRQNISLRREPGLSGERRIVFSRVDYEGNVEEDLLTILTLSGENRNERAKLGNRFELVNGGTVVYAALLNTADGQEPTESQKSDIIDRFRLIFSEWNTGEV